MPKFSFQFAPLVFSEGGKSWGPQNVTIRVEAPTVKEAAEIVGKRLSMTEADIAKVASEAVQKAPEAAPEPPAEAPADPM